MQSGLHWSLDSHPQHASPNGFEVVREPPVAVPNTGGLDRYGWGRCERGPYLMPNCRQPTPVRMRTHTRGQEPQHDGIRVDMGYAVFGTQHIVGTTDTRHHARNPLTCSTCRREVA